MKRLLGLLLMMMGMVGCGGEGTSSAPKAKTSSIATTLEVPPTYRALQKIPGTRMDLTDEGEIGDWNRYHSLFNPRCSWICGGLDEQSPSLSGQVTVLLHEAYLRLVDTETAASWNSCIFSWRRNQCV